MCTVSSNRQFYYEVRFFFFNQAAKTHLSLAICIWQYDMYHYTGATILYIAIYCDTIGI